MAAIGRPTTVIALTLALAGACAHGQRGTSSIEESIAPNVDRAQFNRVAARLNLPLFWMSDTGDGRLAPAELAILSFYPGAPEGPFVAEGAFTEAFYDALSLIETAAGVEQSYAPAQEEGSADGADGTAEVSKAKATPQRALSKAERERRELVREELDQGRPTLIRTDLSRLSDSDRDFVARMMEVAALIDQLYAAQNGLTDLAKQVPADDPASLRLLWRNWRAGCVAPATGANPRCSAIPGAPLRAVGLYPPDAQGKGDFCATLGKGKAAKAFNEPFTALRKSTSGLTGVSYSKAWPELMEAISKALEGAAEAWGEEEPALVAYLRAASDSFISNDWKPADEAWAAMNSDNSRWYLRVGPDETYWEPCSQKAGFHMALALIDDGSLTWKEKLLPLRQEMERDTAELIGPAYVEREVRFSLPDFIAVVANAGDSRHPLGGTLGQSLPNWGPVASEGRGRTVAMTNLGTDGDSLAIRREQAASMLTAEALEFYTDDQQPSLLSTIIHEAFHNLGPSHEHKVKGKTDREVFGGPVASMLEELKAQSAALWYAGQLEQKGVIDRAFLDSLYVNAITWAFGHISQGIYDETGKPKAYSLLSAVQLGYLMKAGAVSWDGEAMAANGTDRGAFSIDYEKLPEAATALMKQVATIKATGDRKAAEAMIKEYVASTALQQKEIAKRYLRFPKSTYVYSLSW